MQGKMIDDKPLKEELDKIKQKGFESEDIWG